MRPGDWSCSSCNAHNYANREQCFKCGKPKGEGDMVVGGDRGAGGGGAGDYGGNFGGGGFGRGRPMKPGDWMCSCYAHNYASRDVCYKCGKSKAEAQVNPQEVVGYGGGGGGYGGGYGGGGYGGGYGGGGYGGGYSGSYGGSFGGGGGGGGRGGRDMRPGDWMCQQCNAHNFASRDACFRCGKAKAECAVAQ